MWIRGATTAAAAVARALAIQASAILAGLEDASVDRRLALRPAAAPANVVVVALDARSLDLLGERPPVPRSLHARMLDRLRRVTAMRALSPIR